MSTTTAFKDALNDLYFNNVDHANVGDASGLQNSAAAGSFYISLHTSTPGISGDQTSNEATFTSYARIAVARTAGGFTIVNGNVSNAAAVTFPEATGGSETVTYFGIGSAISGTGNLQYFGVLGTSRAVSSGVTLEFAIGELDIDLT